MSSKKEVTNLLIIDNPENLRPLREYFEKIFGLDLIREFFNKRKLIYIQNKFGELYSVDNDFLDSIGLLLMNKGIRILSLGLLIGFIRENIFIPSPLFLEEIYFLTKGIRGAVVAREKGVKAFLYGNDLLYESVDKIYEPFRRGYIVGVIDKHDKRVIGVGLAAADLEEIKKWSNDPEYRIKPVVYNKFDLGFFLREQNSYLW